ncbi:hypothetical protein ACQEU8_36150 [Streptomyces sp. CA-250714]|uniref:hypothetical protein n=1 Tax=Streptomyces sp. CA-250714 TaxID=3240060 RepID=UPI003D89DEF9
MPAAFVGNGTSDQSAQEKREAEEAARAEAEAQEKREAEEAARAEAEAQEKREAEEAARAEAEAQEKREAEEAARAEAEAQEKREAEEAARAEAEAQEKREAEEAARAEAEAQEKREAEEAARAEAEADAATDYDESEYQGSATGKVTLQTYVPSSIAVKVKDMQQTGKSAEVIILTAVAQCADRLPELIAEARGPVHEGGLFPGLEIIERGPGRPKKVEPANSRLQYSVSMKWMPTLQAVAKKHNLKQSVLARIALGAYFDIPVRLERVN